MSNAQPTPSPWAIKFRNDHSAYISLGDPVKGEHKQFDIDFDDRYPSDVADARLIAAAPTMLEALVDCRRALELANFTQELAFVDAAIAKATGERA